MWSGRLLRWALWIVALVAVPVPYSGIEDGWVPAFWLLVMATLSAFVSLLEGGRAPMLIALVFAAQAVLASGVLWLASAGLVLLGERVFGHERTVTAAGVLAVLLAGLALCPVYRSPVARTAGWTSLVGLWR